MDRTDARTGKAKLFTTLEPITGWLDLGEAWALHETARRACSRVSSPTVVEVGSYHGRSTISLAYGLQVGGGGRVFAIDPHRRPENNEQFVRNIKDARVEHVVNQMRTFSHEAVKAFEPGMVDVLFLDGAHDYASVFQDIKNWSPMLADGGVIAFNDAVWWSGVQRAILDTIARGRSPFRNPRWVFNTLFLDHVPSARWGAADAVRLARLKLFLRLGGRWARFHKRVESRTWDLAKRLDARLMTLTLRAVLPAA